MKGQLNFAFIIAVLTIFMVGVGLLFSSQIEFIYDLVTTQAVIQVSVDLQTGKMYYDSLLEAMSRKKADDICRCWDEDGESSACTNTERDDIKEYIYGRFEESITKDEALTEDEKATLKGFYPSWENIGVHYSEIDGRTVVLPSDGYLTGERYTGEEVKVSASLQTNVIYCV